MTQPLRRAVLALAAGLTVVGPLRAQRSASDSNVVDRIVAVVGTNAILQSQVEEEIFAQQNQGVSIPTGADKQAEFRKQVMSQIIDVELLVQAAQRDTAIKVTDQEIADGVEQQIQKVRGNFASELDYRAELRKAGFATPEEYRRWLTEQQRRAALQNRLIDKLRSDGKLKPVAPTEREMKVFFETQQAQLGRRPATVSFRQVVLSPKPGAEAKARTLALADSLVQELRRGADFAVAARRYSQDPGSREQGGELNWFRHGVMVPEFDKVAFTLKPGTISDPVETAFGYHIIQVERVQPGEVQARHILLMPEVTQDEADSARALAERLVAAVRAGVPIDSLQRLYHDAGEEKEANDVAVTQLPDPYSGLLAKADSGAVIGPVVLPGPTPLRSKFAVVLVTARRPEGEVRYEDVRDRIKEQLSQQLAIRRYLDRLRASTYVDVREGV